MSADKMPQTVAWMTQGSADGSITLELGEATTNKRYTERWAEYAWVPLVTQAAARAYAAEQTRELVEALESLEPLLEAVTIGLGRVWVEADGSETDFGAALDKARALIAKHKGQA